MVTMKKKENKCWNGVNQWSSDSVPQTHATGTAMLSNNVMMVMVMAMVKFQKKSDIDIAHNIWKISISILLRKFCKILISIRKLSMVCHAWRNIDHWYVGISLNIDNENILKILISKRFFCWKKFIKISIRNFAKHI